MMFREQIDRLADEAIKANELCAVHPETAKRMVELLADCLEAISIFGDPETQIQQLASKISETSITAASAEVSDAL